jgi:NADPH:quinone reductase-like Zn-dependent oxidoreductase
VRSESDTTTPLDTIGNRTVTDLRRAIAPGGKGVVTGFSSMRGLLGVAMRGGKNLPIINAHADTQNLTLLMELAAAGKLRPKIDRRYKFTEIPAAVAYQETNRAAGKVVVGVG